MKLHFHVSSYSSTRSPGSPKAVCLLSGLVGYRYRTGIEAAPPHRRTAKWIGVEAWRVPLLTSEPGSLCHWICNFQGTRCVMWAKRMILRHLEWWEWNETWWPDREFHAEDAPAIRICKFLLFLFLFNFTHSEKITCIKVHFSRLPSVGSKSFIDIRQWEDISNNFLDACWHFWSREMAQFFIFSTLPKIPKFVFNDF